jgi:transcriptional antiterminator RfaH
LQKAQPSWFTVYTKPRQEQTALENLKRQGFHCFLPMAVYPNQHHTGRRSHFEPVFPRSLFLSVIVDQQNLVRFGKQLGAASETVINTIKAKCSPDTGLVQLDPLTVHLGGKVRVIDGPLAGIEGVFRERKGENRALLLMKIPGTESTVEVDALLLRYAM